MRKLVNSMLAVLTLCTVFSVTTKASIAEKIRAAGEQMTSEYQLAEGALDKAYSGQCFKVYAYDMGGASAYHVKRCNGATGVQLQLLTGDKKPLASVTGEFKGADTIDLTMDKGVKEQRYYYYKARAMYANDKKGKWSGFRAFSTYKPESIKKQGKKLYVKTPKAKDVKRFEVWASAVNTTDGFQKVAIVRPGKSVIFTKIGGKAITSYKKGDRFYFHIRPILKSGVKVHFIPYVASVYEVTGK